MSSESPDRPRSFTIKGLDLLRPVGCCAGQALGCGCSFLASWIAALLLSALLTPFFGGYQGGNTTVGVLLSALTCAGSLIIGAVLSFLTGRLFPVLKKNAGESL